MAVVPSSRPCCSCPQPQSKCIWEGSIYIYIIYRKESENLFDMSKRRATQFCMGSILKPVKSHGMYGVDNNHQTTSYIYICERTQRMQETGLRRASCTSCITCGQWFRSHWNCILVLGRVENGRTLPPLFVAQTSLPEKVETENVMICTLENAGIIVHLYFFKLGLR